MSATVIQPVSAKGLTSPAQVIERIRIDDADWQTYEKFLAAIGDRHFRLTYDRGRLEIMPPLRIHEREKKFLGRIIETLTFDLKMTISCCGSMTIRRHDLKRGFEPDECYYITNEPLVRGTRELDFTVDPPPDLALEIDVSSSSLDRIALYAALGIPELWRYEEGDLQFLILQPNQQYASSASSRVFPFLTVSTVADYLSQIHQRTENEILAEFIDWFRQTVLPTLPAAGRPPADTSSS
jgi:Uma2 family endonuclease